MICPACENTVPDHVAACPLCGMVFAGTPFPFDEAHGPLEEETTAAALPSIAALPTEAPRALATPGEPGRYTILRRLGSGGMGVVYKVYDHKMERFVAVKRLNPQRERRGGIVRFFTEAKAIARLNHEHIVSIFDIVEDRRGFFIVMELVRGISLRMWVKRHGPPPARLAGTLLRHVGEALAYAHRRTIIHRDVKPGNILIGRGFVSKIVDFGVAVMGDEKPDPAPRHVAGTRGYIAPELRWRQGRADARTDVYSFGMTVLETFSGQKPWRAREYPVLVSDFILQATRENPDDRFPSMEEALKSWDRVIANFPEDRTEVPAAVRQVLTRAAPRRDLIEIRGGPRDGEIVHLHEPVILVGRSRTRCAIALDDTLASRVHLKIVREEGDAYAFDMGSQNGTFLGTQQIRAVRLSEGMELRVGNSTLRYL